MTTRSISWLAVSRLSVLGVLIGYLWLVLPVPVASAHAYLLASTPPSGYALPTPPTELSLDFDQPVTIGAAPLRLSETAGTVHPLGPPELSLGGRRLAAPVPSRLVDGDYRIRWKVTADDGDLVSGTITFTVGTGTGTATATADGGSGGFSVDSPVVVVARWVMFSGLALALGGLVGDRLTRSVLREVTSEQAARPRPPVLAGTGLGLAALVVLIVAQVGLDLARLIVTGPGRVLAVEALGFAAAALIAGLARHRNRLRRASGVSLLLVVASEGVRAHPHADSPIWGTALIITHLLAATVWIGALLHVLRAARQWRDHLGWTRLLVHDYARLALIAVAVVVGTGTGEALIVLPTVGALVTTPYGLVLLAKIALVAAVLVLAGVSRRRLPTVDRGGARTPLGRTVRVEAAGLVGVLAVTAVLVSVAPAGPVSTALPAPPAPIGPVVPVGTLAGQITVIASASAGQLVIRMTSPGRDDLGTDNTGTDNTGTDNTGTGDSGSDDSGSGSASSVGTGSAVTGAEPGAVRPADYRASAWLAPFGADPAALTLLGCGPGCFTTPVAWHPGINRLSLTVAAPPWSGGTASLDLLWPPRTDPTLLPAVLAAMRAVTRMTVHQAVTSNYTGYPGPEIPLPLSGAEFLSTEPYGSGGGNPVVLTGRPEEIELGLGFPSGIAVRLFIGADHRILREEATTPNHLITSTFDYPPATR